MTVSQLAIALVRIAAIWLLVETLRYGSQAIPLVGYVETPSAMAIVIVWLFPLLIAGGMWFFPAHVAHVVATSRDISKPDSDQTSTIFQVGLALLGAYALLYGVLDLFFYGARGIAEWSYLENADGSRYVSPEAVAGVLVSVVQIPLGIFLIGGRKALADLLFKLRFGW